MNKYTFQEVSRGRTGELFMSLQQFISLYAQVLETVISLRDSSKYDEEDMLLAFRIKVKRETKLSPIDEKIVNECMSISFKGVVEDESTEMGILHKRNNPEW